MTGNPNKKMMPIVEALSVLGLCSLLSAVLLVVFDPGRSEAAAKTAARASEAAAIRRAVFTYRAEHNGALPPGLVTRNDAIQILNREGSCPTECPAADAGKKIVCVKVDPAFVRDYLAGFSTTGETYFAVISENDKIEIGSCGGE